MSHISKKDLIRNSVELKHSLDDERFENVWAHIPDGLKRRASIKDIIWLMQIMTLRMYQNKIQDTSNEK